MTSRPWWRQIGRYARPRAAELAAVIGLALCAAGAGLLTPWPLKLIVDHVLPGNELTGALAWIGRLPGAGSRTGLLAWLAGATVFLFLLRRVLKIAQEYVATGAGVGMIYDLATDLFVHLQRRSLLFHGRQRTGDLVKRVTDDTRCVRELVLEVAVPLLTSSATMIGMLAVTWSLDARLALFALGLSVPLALVARWFARPMADRTYRQKQLEGDLAALAEQTLTAVPIVQAFGRERSGDESYRRLANQAIQASLRSTTSQLQFNASIGAINTFATATVMTLGGFYVLQGSLTVGSLLVLMTYFASLYSPIESIAYLSESFANASAGARRVLEVMAEEDEGVTEAAEARDLPPAADGGAHLRFDAVSFGYSRARPVLHDIDLEIRPGETVALVGPTGAGKTSLVSLVPRLYDPAHGTVRLDGHDLRELRLASLRSSVAVVLQEPFLLPMTVAENIAYGRSEASRTEIEQAAAAAHAQDFILELPDGYDTVVGPRGSTLSGGQRQRLAIARALLVPARVLILDEPTAALDPETEAALVDSLERLKQGRTTLIIAHRLSTVRSADRIVVLENGRITETGTHEQLLGRGGRYARYLELQVGEAELRRRAG